MLLTPPDKPRRLIIDNWLTDEEFASITSLVTGPLFPWNMIASGQVQHGDGGFQLTHLLWNPMEGQVSGLYQEPFNTCMLPVKKIKPVALSRCKFNCNFRGFIAEEPLTQYYHTDFSANSDEFFGNYYTGIYYINTNNGYTQFKEDEAPVKSIGNRLLLFPSRMEHRGVEATDTPVRYVLNMNVALTELPQGDNVKYF